MSSQLTRVADRIAIVNLGISELKAELKSSSDSIVGIDSINDLANNNNNFGGHLLLLYVKKRCLIIQYSRLLSLEKLRGIPDSLLQFLQDPNIAFVGPRNINTKWLFNHIPESFNWKFEFRTAVDIGYLAAKVLKKPKLLTSTLEEVEVEAGVDIKKPISSNGAMRKNWTFSEVLSDEEVKYAMYEVYSCYQIASKFLDVSTAGMARSPTPAVNKKKRSRTGS